MAADRYPRPSTRTIALVALCAAGALAWLRADRVGDAPGGPADRDGRAGDPAPALASPTAPPPWVGGAVAAVVPADDGAMIVVLGADEPPGPASSVPRRLAGGFGGIGRLDWSRDGSRLAFAAQRDGRWDIWAVARDGTGLRRLTDDADFDADPAWSPDGHSIAFASYRDDRFDLYRLALPDSAASSTASSTALGPPTRLTTGDGPAIEPTWSPDGATIAFAAWHDGAYRIEAVGADGADGAGRRVIAPPERPADDGPAGRTAAGDATDAPLDAPGRPPDDLRAPAWSADGSAIAYLAGRHGDARIEAQSIGVDGLPDGRAPSVLAPEAAGFGWVAGGRAVVRITVAGGARRISFRDRTRFSAQDLADLSGDPLSLAAGAMAVAWTASPPEVGLPVARQGVARGGDSLAAGRGGLSGGAPDTAASMPIAADRPGLVDLRDVRVSGARINALLFDDFTALRAEVRASTGADFLGTLSDMWRPIGFFSSASAYFSWHKTGRAFDTQMELRGPGGRRDMVLVREDRAGGRGGPQWRMYLRAGEQDGTIGVPLTVPGWTFSAGGGDAADEADGGRRASTVPTGYWVDFSALAAAHGWRRISAQTSGTLDWRTDWAGIEYWHYERRDGLRWFEAARQVYTDADLASAFGPDRLRALSIPLSRLARQGFPVGWRGEG